MAESMHLTRLCRALLPLSAAALLASCGGGGGSSASAPQNVTVTAGDTQVTITWTQESGVTYWLW
ncbi:MAG: hypothetical protein ACRCTU_08390, partial [Zoogloea sp.]